MNSDDIAIAPETANGITANIIGSRATQEFVRYFAASLIALIVDIGSLALLTSFFHVPYLTSGWIAFTFGLVIVYLLSIFWVFEIRKVRNVWVEFLTFLIIGVVGLGINELVLWIFTGLFGFFYLISKIGSVVIVFSWNFFARKFLLFR